MFTFYPLGGIMLLKAKEVHMYLCIDLKTFYASVECVERGLDPFSVNLVVADVSRGKGTVCLAVSPRMKMLGVKNRCRVYEIPRGIKYIAAMPRMKKYIEYSANIYGIYLKYFAKEDIYVYSIDEAFIDVSKYLKLYNLTVEELAKKVIREIYMTYKITATAGIGTNMYLAKIALDITAKHSVTNIGFLDEEKYKKTLWHHTPLTDFWQIGKGIERRLNKLNLKDMYDIAHADEKRLYKEFGINARLLIDHAKGIEPCTIQDIKNYTRKSISKSSSQVLFKDYPYDKARLVVKEMVELLSLELVEENLVTDTVGVYIGYSKDIVKATGGRIRIDTLTNVYSELVKAVLTLYDKTTHLDKYIRRIGISFENVREMGNVQLSLFVNKSREDKERQVEHVAKDIKKKMGVSSVIRGMNLEKDATTLSRNKLIGGHNSGE